VGVPKISHILQKYNLFADEMDTNGWQWDFWETYIRDGDKKAYILSGSGYYGGLEFRAKEEEY